MNSIFRRYPKHWFCGTAVLLLLYPLALGPTAWFLWNFKVSDSLRDLLQNIFTPLYWSCRKAPYTDKIMGLYLSLWVDFRVVSLTQPRLPVPEPPRFLTESVGIAVATWFIWLFVLWMNQRRADRQTVGLVDR